MIRARPVGSRSLEKRLTLVLIVEFHNIDAHLFRRVLRELEKRGQATVFSDNGADGVKFL